MSVTQQLQAPSRRFAVGVWGNMDSDILPMPRGTWLVLQTDTGSVDVTTREQAVVLLGIAGGLWWDEAVRSGGPHVVRVEAEVVGNA